MLSLWGVSALTAGSWQRFLIGGLTRFMGQTRVQFLEDFRLHQPNGNRAIFNRE